MSKLEQLVNIIDDEYNAPNWIYSNPNEDYDGWRDEYGTTLAQLALFMKNKNPKAVLAMLSNLSADNINNRDNDGFMLIFEAVNYPEVFDALLNTGLVDVNVRNENGHTLLAIAAEIGNIDAVSTLIFNYNVDINDKESDSALILSAMNDKKEVVELLLSQGVDLEDHFIQSWGKEYIDQLRNYERLHEYVELFLKYGLEELIPQEARDIFVF